MALADALNGLGWYPERPYPLPWKALASALNSLSRLSGVSQLARHRVSRSRA